MKARECKRIIKENGYMFKEYFVEVNGTLRNGNNLMLNDHAIGTFKTLKECKKAIQDSVYELKRDRKDIESLSYGICINYTDDEGYYMDYLNVTPTFNARYELK